MKEKVLKALANPPRIFYVPYSLALLNFFICFIFFIVAVVISLITTGDISPILALIFAGVLSLIHMILGIFSKRDPQFAQILFAKFNIFKNKIPKRLVV